jgi:hypothetical protein
MYSYTPPPKTINPNLIKTSLIKTNVGTLGSQQKTQNINNEILSELRDTKQTQTVFIEAQNKLPTLNSVGEGEGNITKQSQIEKNIESDSQIIDMEEIEEMISGSGLDFGKKVKSDYMHSKISDIQGPVSHDGEETILNNINAKSTIYEKKEGEGARVYLLRSI